MAPEMRSTNNFIKLKFILFQLMMTDKLYSTYYDIYSPKMVSQKNVITPNLTVDHFDFESKEYNTKSIYLFKLFSITIK